VSQACSKDPSPQKINLTVGAYRDDKGQSVVLSAVREAERLIFENQMDHGESSHFTSLFNSLYSIEYLPLEGLPEFISAHAKLVFGDESDHIANKRVASIQAVSGTGALRLGGEFLKKFAPVPKIYIPNVTWVNHWHIFNEIGFETIEYSYLDSTGLNLNFDGLINDLSNCPEGSVVLLHMIAHNPSGIDPSPEQWLKILDVVK
jgi:aspartate/tyrosine/aromatic aminotransferase